MAEIEMLEEAPLTLVEVREKLENMKKGQDLSFRGNRTHGYVTKFAKGKQAEVEEMKKKLKALDIVRLKDRHIAKIIDICPEDPETLKAILSGESITVKQEDLQKVLECVK